MKTISENKKRIEEAMIGQDIDIPDSLDGYLIQESNEGDLLVTSPAPDGQPIHYNSRNNTGGRRFVCWVKEATHA